MSKAKRIEQVEAAVEPVADEINDNVVELRRTVAERRDSAVAFVKDHPGIAIAGGIAIGVLAAALLPRRPKSKLGKRGAKFGDAVSATATLIAREAVSRAEASGDGLRKGGRRAAKRSEDLAEQAVRGLGAFVASLLRQTGRLGESASDSAGKLRKNAAQHLAKAADTAENVSVLAGRRIGKAADEARSKIIG